MANINEKAPPGWEGTVRAMKSHHPDKFGKHGDLNPYAIAWSQKKKGAKPHYKDNKKGRIEKKKTFKEWLEENHRSFML